MSPRRLSGLQKQVLSFYRDVIRAARAKNPELKEQIEQYARLEMEKHRDIERKNVMLVEHYLRKGRKQLKLLQEGTIQVRREGNPSLSLSLSLSFSFLLLVVVVVVGCCSIVLKSFLFRVSGNRNFCGTKLEQSLEVSRVDHHGVFSLVDIEGYSCTGEHSNLLCCGAT